MKHLKTVLRITNLFAALLGVGIIATAQISVEDSLRASRDKRITDNYSFTGNAAALSQNIPRTGYARVSAGLVSGDFKRPLEPSASTVYGLSTGGGMSMRNWSLVAAFSYQKRYDKRVAWSGVNEPYGGNPFIWADSSTGSWDRDEVKATIGASLRLAPRLTSGILVDYNIGTGARTSEPKPYYRSREIMLQPGIVYQLSASEQLGVAGAAAFVQEENEIGYYSTGNVLLYRLRGYGTFSKSPFVSGERKRTGTQWKGSVHYIKRWPTYQLLLHAAASQTDEEVYEGVARTQVTGYFTGINLEGKARLIFGTAQKGKSLELLYENKNGYADDMLFRAESASFIHHNLQAELSVWKQQSGKSLVQWNITPSFRYADYADQASYMQFTATTAGGSLQLNYRKPLNDVLRIGISPSAGYYHVMDASFTSRARHVVIQEIIIPDYDYFSSHYWRAGYNFEMEIKPKQGQLSHWVTLSGDLRRSVNKEPSNRTFYQLQYSILF